MVNPIKEPSQKHILRIAKKHFLALGYDGTRMQAIADDSEVNKALLHYYYKNKEGLFKKVFDEEAEKMISTAEEIANKKIPIFTKIELLIENDINHLLKNPDMPMFMMREMARDPSLIKKFDPSGRGDVVLGIVAKEITEAQKKGLVRKEISVQDIFINMAAMVMFPFIAKPFCKTGAHMNEKEYTQWLIQRKKTIPEFIIRAIKT
jgi:TetR/AcrR family transcriptional regulator